MTRAKRIALAVLILWTLLHVFLWSLNGFRLEPSCTVLWPLDCRIIWSHPPPSDQYCKESIWHLMHYDAFEFILYVGMPWALFVAWLLGSLGEDKKEHPDPEE